MDHREQNRAMWDERVPIHVRSDFYDVAGFKAGRCTLLPFEPEELGSVDGKDLAHLQCHFGLDTLSWARRGARVTGLDFSKPAIDAAEALARETGLGGRFVCADVYDAPRELGQQYDILYTGLGALIWLHDIRRWAGVVADLLRPGGTFYIVEMHPFTDVFADETLDVKNDYFFDPRGTVWEGGGTYADPNAPTEVNRSVEFRHPLSDVIGALLERGLRLELFHEHDHTVFARWPFIERRDGGIYRLPAGMARLPLLYSLRAKKP